MDSENKYLPGHITYDVESYTFYSDGQVVSNRS